MCLSISSERRIIHPSGFSEQRSAYYFGIGMDDMIATLFPYWKAMARVLMVEEAITVWKENIASPLKWNLIVQYDVIRVTYRIRKYVLDGDTKEAWRLKESYKDTFSMEAVAVSSSVPIHSSLIIYVHINFMLIRRSPKRRP